MNREMNAHELELFSAWRSDALAKMPYLAMLLFNLRPVSSTWVHFAAVDDGMRLYLNFENLSKHGPDFGAEALLHECSHVIAEHSKIAQQLGLSSADHNLWNVAADLAINDDLAAAGCDSVAVLGVVPEKVVLNGKPLEPWLTPNEYFFALKSHVQGNQNGQGQQGNQNGQGQQGNQNGQGQQGNQNGQGQQGNQNGQGQQGNQNGQGQQGNQNGQGQQGNQNGQGQDLFKGCGSGSGGAKGHGELAQDDSMDGAATPIDPDERAYIIQETARAIENHIKSRGTVPGGFAELIEKLTQKDTIRWEKLLASYVRNSCKRIAGKKIQTYSRVNRRRATQQILDEQGNSHGRVIYPGTVKFVPTIRVYLDTSASMSRNEIEKGLATIMNLARRMKIKGENLQIVNIDSKLHQAVKFNGFDSIKKIAGRGGTDMRRCFEDASSLKDQPDIIIIFTDGETPWPEHSPKYTTIIATTGNSKHYPTPNWAKTIKIKVD